jgi:hypothetical protein
MDNLREANLLSGIRQTRSRKGPPGTVNASLGWGKAAIENRPDRRFTSTCVGSIFCELVEEV